MKFDIIGRVCRIAVIGATLLGSASCIRPEAKLRKELEEKISIQEAFDCYTDDMYSEDDE